MMFFGNRLDVLDKLTVVGAGHIREAGPEGLIVRTDQRVRQHIDMVADDHQIAYMKRLIDASRRIRNEQILHTEQLHHTHGKSDLLHRVSFVIMETSLHGHHRPPPSIPKIKQPLCPMAVEFMK